MDYRNRVTHYRNPKYAYNYGSYKRNKNSTVLYTKSRRNDYATKHPGKSFAKRNKGVENRYKLDQKTGKNKGKEDGPSQEQWSAALKDLRDWLGPVHVCLTGGEALLRPYTVDLMEYGSRLGLLMELLTHGYWKDQTRIEADAKWTWTSRLVRIARRGVVRP